MGAPCASIRLPAGRRLPARFATRHLAHRHAAGRHVEQERRLGGGAGHADADRIGGEARVAPAEGRHQPDVIHHVHEVERDEPGRAGHLAVGADPPTWCEFARVTTTTPVSRLRSIAAAIASPATRRPNPRWPSNMRKAPSSFTAFDGGVGDDEAFLQVPHVVRDQADAVAVVAGEIGVDEVRGDEVGLGGLAAAAGEDGSGEPAETVGGYAHDAETNCACRSKQDGPAGGVRFVLESVCLPRALPGSTRPALRSRGIWSCPPLTV